MDFSILILVVAAAAVGYFVWNQRKGSAGDGSDTTRAGTGAPAATSLKPATAGASASGASVGVGSSAAPFASYEEYRRAAPSNMVYGKLTCNRCGSNLIRTAGGTASCTSCGAALYRA